MMFPYQNKSLPAVHRAGDLLSRLTLDEKLGLLNMRSAAVPRLGVPEYHWWNEALHGVARIVKATMFPQAIALAATFTPDYAYRMGKIIRDEAWIKHLHCAAHGQRDIYTGLTMYSPNINIFRDPRWGRGHETYGECPVLTALMGTAYVKGVQEEDGGQLKCSTTLKHFAAHSGPEGTRSTFDAIVSDLDWAQTYLYAFRYCLKHAGAKSIMTAYNAVNGTPMSANEPVVRQMLRGEWQFNGVVVTDVGTAAWMVSARKTCQDIPEALALEISSGVDVCCEVDDEAQLHFRQAYDRGLLKDEDIDRAVANQLTLRFELGMFDSQELPDYSRLECREHRLVSRHIAERGVVLLKNDGILPLKPDFSGKVAVIGPTAQDIDVLKGNYFGTPTRYVTLLEGMLDCFGEDNVIYARGCEVFEDITQHCALPGDRIAEAVTAAENADLVVLCMGLTPVFEGEQGSTKFSGDKERLEYPACQMRLLEALCHVGKPIVLLNCSGSALVLPSDKVNAVLQVFYPGPEGGRVVADILTGKVNPSGRLPLTFYASTDALPPFYDYAMKGRTYRYCSDNILYPFGFGLSYTQFKYSDLKSNGKDAEGNIPSSVKVSNTGKLPGETTVLFFFKHENGPSYEPLKQFAGSVRISLGPGECRCVDFTYPAELLAFANEQGVFSPLIDNVVLMVEGESVRV